MDIDHHILLVGSVAHDYLVRAVHPHRPLVHQHSERLRCKSCVFPSRLALIDPLGTGSSRMSSELVVLLIESEHNLIFFCTATFLGARRAITRSARTWASSRQAKATTPSRWPCRRLRPTSMLRTRTRYMCCRPSHPRRIKRSTRQLHRRISTVISGQSTQRLFTRS
jgi:hypothetical protein